LVIPLAGWLSEERKEEREKEGGRNEGRKEGRTALTQIYFSPGPAFFWLHVFTWEEGSKFAA
jgi:hypothetical protein